MTREEAIEILRGAIKKPNTKDGYLGQAIDMAIEALEQQNELFRIGLLKDCESCKAQSCNLDNIRAEILSIGKYEEYRELMPNNELEQVIKIIDKYSAEMEGEDGILDKSTQ